MAYQALYRTYRPKDFDSVAGQEHITKTFKNALLKNKLTHAYLFSGPRGTGKTSVAKIIAKAVNCELAPVANPCNECDICKGIDRNVISDVIEIDAASNNGVDEIREIRDKVKYLPGAATYKVYIIDEVHMLSQGAFNALLKTLEEPPKHVIFILATTEPHKIPATIHSRCQRFDFRGIGLDNMLEHLNMIVEKESLEINKEALRLIAESAEGSMRDAISLLDQVFSYADKEIQVDDVHAIKGSIAYEDIIRIANAVEEDDVVEAMQVLDALIATGKETNKLLGDLVKFYRDVLIYKNAGVSEEERLLYQQEAFKTLAKDLTNTRIFYYIDILNDTHQKMRYSGDSKLYLELAFIKMIDKERKKETIALEKIMQLEENFEALKDTVDNWTGPKVETTDEPGIDKETVDAEDKEEPVQAQFDSVESEDDSSDEQDTIEDKPSLKEEKKETMEEDAIPNAFNKIYNTYAKKTYRTFDIRYVEDVLNTADREVKIDMVKKWFDIERVVDSAHMDYAKMITSGSLVATNGVMMIVAYDSFAMCNRIMTPETNEKLVGVLEKYYDRKVMLMALPEEIWTRISNEFIKKFRAKESDDGFIKLKPIEHSRLVEIPHKKETYEDVESDSLKEAKDLFGDIVKVKRGE